MRISAEFLSSEWLCRDVFVKRDLCVSTALLSKLVLPKKEGKARKKKPVLVSAVCVCYSVCWSAVQLSCSTQVSFFFFFRLVFRQADIPQCTRHALYFKKGSPSAKPREAKRKKK